MRIEEVFHDDDQVLEESFAIAKIRKEALERSKAGKRPSITVLQGTENKFHYIVFVSEQGKTYKTEMIDGKFKKNQRLSVSKAASMINELELKGWKRVDARGWVEKYRVPIFFGTVGAMTGLGLASAGMVPITAILMPIISTFLAVFANLFAENIKNPLKSMFGGE